MYTSAATAVCIFISVLLAHGIAEENVSNVYFTLIYSGGENGYNSSGGIPSIHIALEAIDHHQLLPGYNLTYETARNSKVTPNKNALIVTISNTRACFCPYYTNIAVHTY